MGILYPTFIIHTSFGINAFFNSSDECKETMTTTALIYVIAIMFALSMCFICAILLCCVLIPTWLNVARRQRRIRNRLADNEMDLPNPLNQALVREDINREQIEEILQLLAQELN